jgi:hypothetical protein
MEEPAMGRDEFKLLYWLRGIKTDSWLSDSRRELMHFGIRLLNLTAFEYH